MHEVKLAALLPPTLFLFRHQGIERGVQTFHRPSTSPSAHGFLGVVELERPLASLWCLIRDHSKTHLYNKALKSAWTRPLDDNTQLGNTKNISMLPVLQQYLSIFQHNLLHLVIPNYRRKI